MDQQEIDQARARHIASLYHETHGHSRETPHQRLIARMGVNRAKKALAAEDSRLADAKVEMYGFADVAERYSARAEGAAIALKGRVKNSNGEST